MTCPRCRLNLAELPGRIRLRRSSLLHCPLCGASCGPPQARGVFWSESQKRYYCWRESTEQYPNDAGYVPVNIRYGCLTVTVEAQLLSLENCLYPRLAIFKRNRDDRDPPHFTPLRPEYELFIERCELISYSQNHRAYRVRSRDGFESTHTVGAVEILETERSGAALYIWPNFLCPGWKRYYVAFFSPETPSGSGRIEYVIGSTEQLAPGELYAAVDFVPESVVIKWTADGREYFARYRTQEGSAPHLLTQDDLGQFGTVENLTVGYDFGTTNSSAAAFYTDGQGNQEVALHIHDRTLRLLDGKVADPENTWLPQPTPGSEPFASIPSQLYFQRGCYWNWINDHCQPPLDFTIPYHQRLPGETNDRVASEFKWRTRLRHPQAAETLRRLYFNLSLQLFLAELVGQYRIQPGELRLVSPHPLAFEDEDILLHQSTLRHIQPLLEAATGFRIVLGERLDESHAAEACGETIPEAAVTIYMDVGGGTTDLGVSAGAGRQRQVVAVDSIEFGGEDLNRAVEPLAGVTAAELRATIRRNGSRTYQDPAIFQGNEQHVGLVRQAIERYRRGVIEIAARFVAAAAQAGEGELPAIGLMMLGNGWKTLYPDSADHAAIAENVRRQVERRLDDYRRCSVLSRQFSLLCRYPPDPKGVVAKGAAKRIALPFDQVQAQTQTFLLENVEILVNNQLRRFRWTDFTRQDLNGVPQSVWVVESDGFNFDLPDGEQLDECVRGTMLWRSPFSLRITKHYRKRLIEARGTALPAAGHP